MNDYEEQQRKRDKEYLDAWKNLPAAQRKQMAKLGITGPEQPCYELHKPDQSACLENAVAPDALPAGDCDSTPCEPADPLTDERIWGALRGLVSLIEAQDNIRLSFECFSLVSGMECDDQSMAELARRHGVSRAAVSKRCVELTESLGINPTSGMRKLTTRARYGRRAKHCHMRGAH